MSRPAVPLPIAFGLVAALTVVVLAHSVTRYGRLARQFDRGDEHLTRRAERMRAKMAAVREYEIGRIGLTDAAGRFAAADASDPARLDDIREQYGTEPDKEVFARMVLEYVQNTDAAQPERPPVWPRAVAEFERTFGHPPGWGNRSADPNSAATTDP